MKSLVQRLISTGADLSTKKALKNTLNYLGISPDNIDRLYVELKNSMYAERMRKIPNGKKFVFLPQCLRNPRCKATLDSHGWKCAKCEAHGECKVYKIKDRAESQGYRVFVVPGGSLVLKIIDSMKPLGVIGVGCLKELVMAIEEIKIPAQGVMLTRDGCVNTDVSIKEVFELL